MKLTELEKEMLDMNKKRKKNVIFLHRHEIHWEKFATDEIREDICGYFYYKNDDRLLSIWK